MEQKDISGWTIFRDWCKRFVPQVKEEWK